jgi:hypothetical protein
VGPTPLLEHRSEGPPARHLVLHPPADARHLLFTPNTHCGLIDATLIDATKKLDKARFAYEQLPPDIKAAAPLKADGERQRYKRTSDESEYYMSFIRYGLRGTAWPASSILRLLSYTNGQHATHMLRCAMIERQKLITDLQAAAARLRAEARFNRGTEAERAKTHAEMMEKAAVMLMAQSNVRRSSSSRSMRCMSA